MFPHTNLCQCETENKNHEVLIICFELRPVETHCYRYIGNSEMQRKYVKICQNKEILIFYERKNVFLLQLKEIKKIAQQRLLASYAYTNRLNVVIYYKYFAYKILWDTLQ